MVIAIRKRQRRRGVVNQVEREQENQVERLEDSEIDEISVILFDASELVGKEEEGTECVVCLSTYQQGEELRLLPCGHKFHKECVDEWFHCSVYCPLCKRNMKDELLSKAADPENEINQTEQNAEDHEDIPREDVEGNTQEDSEGNSSLNRDISNIEATEGDLGSEIPELPPASHDISSSDSDDNLSILECGAEGDMNLYESQENSHSREVSKPSTRNNEYHAIPRQSESEESEEDNENSEFLSS